MYTELHVNGLAFMVSRWCAYVGQACSVICDHSYHLRNIQFARLLTKCSTTLLLEVQHRTYRGSMADMSKVGEKDAAIA